MKNKKGLITAAVAVILSLIAVFTIIMPSVNRQSMSNAEKSITDESGDTVNKPTFMYFVTKADLEDGATKEAIRGLEAEFGKKVIFDIKNVDSDKSLLENFPIVDGNTPALIMLKSDGDISGFFFKTNDYDKLKEAVEKEIN